MINSYPFQLFYSLNIHLVLCYVIHQQSEQHNIHSLHIFGGEVSVQNKMCYLANGILCFDYKLHILFGKIPFLAQKNANGSG